MTGKWTPGPWRLEPKPARYPRIGNGTWIVAGELHVASVSMGADKPMGQKIADAHLIAAAPAMADAIAEYLSAKAAFVQFGRENPNDSTSRWDRVFDARNAAEEHLQVALSQALGETP